MSRWAGADTRPQGCRGSRRQARGSNAAALRRGCVTAEREEAIPCRLPGESQAPRRSAGSAAARLPGWCEPGTPVHGRFVQRVGARRNGTAVARFLHRTGGTPGPHASAERASPWRMPARLCRRRASAGDGCRAGRLRRASERCKPTRLRIFGSCSRDNLPDGGTEVAGLSPTSFFPRKSGPTCAIIHSLSLRWRFLRAPLLT
jgi:hypothetical protein